eukprot:gene5977-5267_t
MACPLAPLPAVVPEFPAVPDNEVIYNTFKERGLAKPNAKVLLGLLPDMRKEGKFLEKQYTGSTKVTHVSIDGERHALQGPNAYAQFPINRLRAVRVALYFALEVGVCLASPLVPSHAAPLVPSHAAPLVPSHGAPLVPSHAAPLVPSHAAPLVPSHAAPLVPSHAASLGALPKSNLDEAVYDTKYEPLLRSVTRALAVITEEKLSIFKPDGVDLEPFMKAVVDRLLDKVALILKDLDLGLMLEELKQQQVLQGQLQHSQLGQQQQARQKRQQQVLQGQVQHSQLGQQQQFRQRRQQQVLHGQQQQVLQGQQQQVVQGEQQQVLQGQLQHSQVGQQQQVLQGQQQQGLSGQLHHGLSGQLQQGMSDKQYQGILSHLSSIVGIIVDLDALRRADDLESRYLLHDENGRRAQQLDARFSQLEGLVTDSRVGQDAAGTSLKRKHGCVYPPGSKPSCVENRQAYARTLSSRAYTQITSADSSPQASMSSESHNGLEACPSDRLIIRKEHGKHKPLDEIALPFTMPLGWIIPNTNRGESADVWTSWCGRQIGGASLDNVLTDWDYGLWNKNGAPLAPLRILEHSLLRSFVWRWGGDGNKMKNLMYWKVLVYALHRRVTGGPRSQSDVDGDVQHAPMDLQAAKEDLGRVQKDIGPETGLSGLSRGLLEGRQARGVEKEFSPDVYEKRMPKDSLSLTTSSKWATSL